jgi:hypothetical protein
MRGVSRRAHHRLLAVLVTALLVLHIDVWNHGRGGLVFGWLPWDLAYHLAWMVGATAVVWYMTLGPWPDEDA